MRQLFKKLLTDSAWLAIALLGFVVALLWMQPTESVMPLEATAPAVTPLPDSLARHTMYYGMLANPAREYLESKWTDSTYQVEQGYCVDKAIYYQSQQSDSQGRNYLVMVLNVLPALARKQSYYEGTFTCPKNMPLVHTHPPITCRQLQSADLSQTLSCERGGPNAFQCEPSRKDYMSLLQTGLPFGVIQCDRRAFVFYWPHQYRENDFGAKHFTAPPALAGEDGASRTVQKLPRP